MKYWGYRKRRYFLSAFLSLLIIGGYIPSSLGLSKYLNDRVYDFLQERHLTKPRRHMLTQAELQKLFGEFKRQPFYQQICHEDIQNYGQQLLPKPLEQQVRIALQEMNCPAGDDVQVKKIESSYDPSLLGVTTVAGIFIQEKPTNSNDIDADLILTCYHEAAHFVLQHPLLRVILSLSNQKELAATWTQLPARSTKESVLHAVEQKTEWQADTLAIDTLCAHGHIQVLRELAQRYLDNKMTKKPRPASRVCAYVVQQLERYDAVWLKEYKKSLKGTGMQKKNTYKKQLPAKSSKVKKRIVFSEYSNSGKKRKKSSSDKFCTHMRCTHKRGWLFSR